MIQAPKFIKKRLHHRYFLVINAQFFRKPILKIISENICKILRKSHMLESLFNKVIDL